MPKENNPNHDFERLISAFAVLKYSAIRQPYKDDKPKDAEIMPFQAGSGYSLSANRPC